MSHRTVRASLSAVLALGLLGVAQALAYRSVDVTLAMGNGALTVSPSTRVSPVLGAANPPVRDGVAFVRAAQDLGEWNVGLSPKMPLALTVKQDTGESRINLSGLPVTRLTMAQGNGLLSVRLPARTLAVSIRQDVGSVQLYPPRDTGVRIALALDSGSLKIESREVASGQGLKGSYQTANFDTAKYRVTVTLAKGNGQVEIFAPGQVPQ